MMSPQGMANLMTADWLCMGYMNGWPTDSLPTSPLEPGRGSRLILLRLCSLLPLSLSLSLFFLEGRDIAFYIQIIDRRSFVSGGGGGFFFKSVTISRENRNYTPIALPCTMMISPPAKLYATPLPFVYACTKEEVFVFCATITLV